MEALRRIEGLAVGLPLANVDTDQILPARYLKVSRAQGFGDFLFRDLRFDREGRVLKDFPLNDPAASGARILVARRNFGVGSSREAAVYALVDYGIRCVLAPSFGDIFAGNAVNNGLLAGIITDADAEALLAAIGPAREAAVDLDAATISLGNRTIEFTIDPVRRTKLLNGWDDLDLTMSYRDRIAAFQQADHTRRPWAIPARRGD